MKQFALPFLTLMIGLLVGSWGPKSDLRIANLEIARLKLEGPKNEPSSRSMMDVTKMLGVAAPARSPNRSDRKPPRTPDVETDKKSEVNETPSPSLTPPIIENQEDFKKAIDAARDIWLARSAQARQLLIEQLKLTEQEAREFDKLTKTMNEKLQKQIQKTVDSLKANDTFLPEDGMMMVHEISGVMLDVYSEADKVFPADWRYNVTEDSDLINFIDPEVALPLLTVKGAFGEEGDAVE
jgi:hypothetical protein